MSKSNALITWGGWDGHEPEKVAHLMAGMLGEQGLTADIYDRLDCFDDLDALCGYDLIIPVWTCLLYTSPSPRDLSTSRMPSSA